VPVAPARDFRRAGLLLAFVFSATWFISTAMAAHLPRLLQSAGATLTVAVSVGAMVGPAQVVARLLEYGAMRRAHPLLSARIASLMHPLGAAMLVLLGGPAAPHFAILHGAGNGILTIAKGTLPLALFGPAGYGLRQGALMVPTRMAQALAPWLFGVCLDRWGARALWTTAGLGLLAFAALRMLPRTSRPARRRRPSVSMLEHGAAGRSTRRGRCVGPELPSPARESSCRKEPLMSITFQQFEADALARGFDEALERRWSPDQVVDEHRHPFTADALVVDGEMWLTEAGETRHLMPGDTFHLEQDVPHAERYGPTGAVYWVARREGRPG
jgi:hypothetical protein